MCIVSLDVTCMFNSFANFNTGPMSHNFENKNYFTSWLIQ